MKNVSQRFCIVKALKSSVCQTPNNRNVKRLQWRIKSFLSGTDSPTQGHLFSKEALLSTNTTVSGTTCMRSERFGRFPFPVSHLLLLV